MWALCATFPVVRSTTSFADSYPACRNSLVLFALHQRNLRGELYIHHHADAAIQLKKCGRAFSAQNLADHGHILGTKCLDLLIDFQPATDIDEGILVGHVSP